MTRTRSASAGVPAGLVVWEGDDDELRVGNDGRPLLLPYLLRRERGRKAHEVGEHIHDRRVSQRKETEGATGQKTTNTHSTRDTARPMCHRKYAFYRNTVCPGSTIQKHFLFLMLFNLIQTN